MESVFATKLLSHGVPSLFHLLSCCVNSLTKGTDVVADGEPLLIVFKIEKRSHLLKNSMVEEGLGRTYGVRGCLQEEE